MSSNAALDLQSALYARLNSDAGLAGVAGSPQVFDHVPAGTPYPYVTLAGIETRPWHTQTSIGSEHIVTLHIWSDHHGAKQAHAIIAALDDALDNAALALEDHVLINLHTIFWTVQRGLDGKHHQGTMRLRAVTERI